MDKIPQILIDKYLANTCTQEEKEEVEHWYKSFEQRADFLEGIPEEEQHAIAGRMLGNIHERLEEKRNGAIVQGSEQSIKPDNPRRYFWLKVAAVLMVFSVATVLLYGYIGNQPKLYETAYGERNIIMLPDGSKVVLNGKTSLRTAKDWSSDHIREVWLEGEAFFSVQHTKNHQKFLVHTADGVTVEVLGTEFNVKKRQSGTQVVLREGSIRLHLQKESGKEEKAIILKPGEMVEVATSTRKTLKAAVKTESYTSWQAPKMVFDNTPVRDIVKMLQETYGYEVEVQEEELLSTHVSGLVPNDNVEVLLEALGETLEVDIQREKKHLVFLKK